MTDAPNTSNAPNFPNAPNQPASTEPEMSTRKAAPMPKEIGGPKGPEPTRYGDWEVKGRCTDF